ncbi:hypothetical protein Micbo1qcDRAFT_178790 [Microdochium bolleyi]|uniref:Uncharacterized protein n=1 Tax=Microdochium bolleyi TaxID=196109 RepID=A0A136IRX5_9PEZI|nr:hypothetical protein Micbo1qcDRAFT_178790 [Microdochium bolleyi]
MPLGLYAVVMLVHVGLCTSEGSRQSDVPRADSSAAALSPLPQVEQAATASISITKRRPWEAIRESILGLDNLGATPCVVLQTARAQKRASGPPLAALVKHRQRITKVLCQDPRRAQQPASPQPPSHLRALARELPASHWTKVT